MQSAGPDAHRHRFGHRRPDQRVGRRGLARRRPIEHELPGQTMPDPSQGGEFPADPHVQLGVHGRHRRDPSVWHRGTRQTDIGKLLLRHLANDERHHRGATIRCGVVLRQRSRRCVERHRPAWLGRAAGCARLCGGRHRHRILYPRIRATRRPPSQRPVPTSEHRARTRPMDHRPDQPQSIRPLPPRSGDAVSTPLRAGVSLSKRDCAHRALHHQGGDLVSGGIQRGVHQSRFHP